MFSAHRVCCCCKHRCSAAVYANQSSNEPCRDSPTLQAACKVATVGEDENEAAAAKQSSKSVAAAEAGAASPDAGGMAKLAAAADGKPDAADEAEGKGRGPSAALDIPFTPMALAFRCGVAGNA